MKITPTVDMLRKVCKEKGYAFFENGDYNLNIIGIRANPGTVNKFDDLITVSYKVDGKWQLKLYKGTTDPGLYWLNNLMNVNGTAILKEGQYRQSHHIGMHKDKYKALTQLNKLTVYRDRNLDDKHNMNENNLDTGIFGINIHRATNNKGMTSVQVDKWSAGCQVIASYDDFEEFMNLVEKSAAKYGNKFTYTLLNEKDFKEV